MGPVTKVYGPNMSGRCVDCGQPVEGRRHRCPEHWLAHKHTRQAANSRTSRAQAAQRRATELPFDEDTFPSFQFALADLLAAAARWRSEPDLLAGTGEFSATEDLLDAVDRFMARAYYLMPHLDQAP